MELEPAASGDTMMSCMKDETDDNHLIRSFDTCNQIYSISLLHDCHQRGPGLVAQDLTERCESEIDQRMMREMALQLLQRLGADGSTGLPPSPCNLSTISQAMDTPYSNVFNAESNEHLFEALNQLLDVEGSIHTMKASQRATALWGQEEADKLVKTYQEWRHTVSSFNRSNEMHRFLHRWFENVVERPTTSGTTSVEEWILFINPDDLQENSLVLTILRDNYWAWLLATLRKAFKEWNMDAVYFSLFIPNVRKVWDTPPCPPTARTMQCLVFIARVYYATRLLKLPELQSPSLRAKVLRCGQLLEEQTRLFVKSNVKHDPEALKLEDAIKEMRRPSMQQLKRDESFKNQMVSDHKGKVPRKGSPIQTKIKKDNAHLVQKKGTTSAKGGGRPASPEKTSKNVFGRTGRCRVKPENSTDIKNQINPQPIKRRESIAEKRRHEHGRSPRSPSKRTTLEQAGVALPCAPDLVAQGAKEKTSIHVDTASGQYLGDLV